MLEDLRVLVEFAHAGSMANATDRLFQTPFNRPGVRSVMHLRNTLVAVLPGLLSLSIPRTTRAELAVTASVSMDRDLMEVTVPQLQTFHAEHRYRRAL